MRGILVSQRLFAFFHCHKFVGDLPSIIRAVGDTQRSCFLRIIDPLEEPSTAAQLNFIFNLPGNGILLNITGGVGVLLFASVNQLPEFLVANVVNAWLSPSKAFSDAKARVLVRNCFV